MDIDVVVTWVDGSDPQWLAEKQKYMSGTLEDNRNFRYRDWGTLKFWFRGIEKFMPWVRKIHFVTWGHLPEWLDLSNPRLHIVKHSDYMPERYLPTYNSRVIELNFHRIPDLAEHFIYFNDDMFVLQPVSEDLFFSKTGLPCDTLLFDLLIPKDSTYVSTLFNNIAVVNKHFNKSEFIKQHKSLLYNKAYGKSLFRTILLQALPDRLINKDMFTGFFNPHTPTSYLKSTYETVWEEEGNIFEETCMHRFRNMTNVNHFLVRYWQMLSGEFEPVCVRGNLMILSESNEHIFNAIKKQEYSLLCINDDDYIERYDEERGKLLNAFEKVFYEKSSYER